MFTITVVPPKHTFSISSLRECLECGSKHVDISIEPKEYRTRTFLYDKSYIEEDSDTLTIYNYFPELFLTIKCFSCGANGAKVPLFNCNSKIKLANDGKLIIFLTEEWWHKYGHYLNKTEEV